LQIDKALLIEYLYVDNFNARQTSIMIILAAAAAQQSCAGAG